MTDSFYNTIRLTGRLLTEAEQKALTQEQRILRYVICFHGYLSGSCSSFAPSAIQQSVFGGEGVPITSVRRAMTSLTQRGDLVKLGAMIIGPYGKPEHLWTASAKWNRHEPKQGELL